ncbi:MAG: DNA translocase FtsK [Clostridiales bacterium]|nr:DNA translocase FtsK [Clostridiales bacterium]
MARPVKKTTTSKKENMRSELKQDLIAIALFAAGIFLALCLWLAPGSRESNLFGALGFGIYQAIQRLFGQGKWFPAISLVLLGAGGWLKAGRPGKILYAAYIAVTCSGCAIMHLSLPEERQVFAVGLEGAGGGIIGGALVHGSRLLIGSTGSWILYIALVAASILIITGKTIRELLSDAGGKAKSIAQTAQSGFSRLAGLGEDKTGKRGPDVISSLNLPTNTELQADKQEYAQSRGIPFRAPAGERAEGQGARQPGEGPKDDPAAPSTAVSLAAAGGRAGRRKKAEDGQPDDGELLPAERGARPAKGQQAYQTPGLSLLRAGPKAAGQRQSKVVSENVRILEKTLSDFGVKAVVTQVNRGPSITRYELQPAPGVKVSRITSLSDDIALALAASNIRIEAPIPGKAAVGIEVPNEERAMVSLREILEDPAYTKSKSKLTFALGRDIAGASIVADLAKMPHLLIAGATGAGKSVCINSLIVSLLISTRPDEVKLMMVDPKMVELTVYNDIPHLIYPVVTEPKKAAKALRWAVHEMERRYDAFAEAGVRDISGYNAWLAQREDTDKPDTMPFIVIIIDELADLMMVASTAVEESISRLAAMARAAGMHIVVATQRPSVDVITGVIKANIPSRIAFAVSSQTDSRVILDAAGAEKLLGKGDMLYSTLENPKPVRVQGVYVSDQEIENVTDFIKSANARADYLDDENIQVADDQNEENEELDVLLPEAARIFIESGQASISLLQRRLRIGYTRAARIIDQMEQQGIVGGFEGSKARAIRMTMAQYEERFGTGQ